MNDDEEARSTRLARHIERIAGWVAKNLPDGPELLLPPASAQAIADAEQRLALRFPPDLRALYRLADGQAPGSPSLWFAFRWMPLAEAVDAAGFLDDSFPDGINLDHPDHAPIQADPEVRPAWWCRGWLPFMENGGGDYLCVDLNPASASAQGQVVTYYHDDVFRRRIAGDVGSLFSEISEQLSNGTAELMQGMICLR